MSMARISPPGSGSSSHSSSPTSTVRPHGERGSLTHFLDVVSGEPGQRTCPGAHSRTLSERARGHVPVGTGVRAAEDLSDLYGPDALAALRAACA